MKLYSLLIIFSLLTVSPQETTAQTVSTGDVEATIEYWAPYENGNMFIIFQVIDKDGVHNFSHQYQILSSAEKVPSCDEIQVKDSEVWLFTMEPYPVKYIINKFPVNFDGQSGEIKQ